MMSACFLRNTIPRKAACSGISLRPFPISPWSTPPTISRPKSSAGLRITAPAAPAQPTGNNPSRLTRTGSNIPSTPFTALISLIQNDFLLIACSCGCILRAPTMATPAQIEANRANAQHSTGPKTEAGKARSSLNRLRWGFRGQFRVLPSESQEEFELLLENLRAEHQPQTTVEEMLLLKLAQHFWLSQRAQRLVDRALDRETEARDPEQTFTLWLRYQTTNDRAFHRCLDQLLKLRAQRVREAIGFERQKRAAEQAAAQAERQRQQEERAQAAEKRKQQRHELAVLLTQARIDHQSLRNFQLDPAHPLAFAATERLLKPQAAPKKPDMPQAA